MPLRVQHPIAMEARGAAGHRMHFFWLWATWPRSLPTHRKKRGQEPPTTKTKKMPLVLVLTATSPSARWASVGPKKEEKRFYIRFLDGFELAT
jgi:hypothetical protein